ncbi:MAG TPA: DUF4910 domain-containing protein [Bryobacteraceae bacterium]|nr:DUF4910 domain-containing protein [Bryobacteraceae bacterium]
MAISENMIGRALSFLTLAAALQAQPTLLPEPHFKAIEAEASGALAKDTIIELGRFHRVHASPGFHEAAQFIATRAREYGLEDVHIESFPADGKTTYNSFRSYLGWDGRAGVLTEIAPSPHVIADFSKSRVALADYSNDADVTAELIDVGQGTRPADYDNRNVKGKIVLAGGNVADAHHEAVELRGAAGVLSYQPNQVTAWSGDYQDLVRWGHLSPYNTRNTFAFMISLREARDFRNRLAKGEKIRLYAQVTARMQSGNFEVVTGVIPGTDPSAGEIVYSCHLCHEKPGANDNASGAAAILEDARILVALIKAGKIPPPRRTIRFIWPPEIAGTMCYLSRHADELAKMRAAIHMDMVGGDPQITKAILHLTRTPASLPSFVNDVAASFGERVINGASRAAMDADLSDANFSPEGTKDALLADFHSFTMGSDHDVYEEGSFRVPTIYMNDWPDVFIHTNGDVPANMNATKLQRVAVIGAAAGYYLASAGPKDADRLAGEVLARSGVRLNEALQRSLADPQRSRDIIDEANREESEVLKSVSNFVPETAAEIDRRKPKLSPPQSARGPVPKRNPAVRGNLDVYYYDYLKDHVNEPFQPALQGLLAYEALNLVDGHRSIEDIGRILSGAYEGIDSKALLDYFHLLEKAGVITIMNM